MTKIQVDGEPYVDVLPAAVLRVVVAAMDSALDEQLREVWPAIVRSGKVETRPYKKEEQEIATDVDPHRVLVPLSRLGAAQGYSGAKVFVGYFADKKNRYLPSRPLVVKVGTWAELDEELHRARAWPPHAQGENSSFAWPWKLYPIPAAISEPHEAVLIANFTSIDSLDMVPTRYDLRIEDLWKQLTGSDSSADLARTLRSVYELIHGVHRHGKVVCERRTFVYGDLYDRYLRRLTKERRQIPVRLFGDQPTTQLYGRSWPNPLCTVDALLRLTCEGAIGPTHGDLHPKNVVLDKSGRPRIIDFGWATPSSHVVVDYVLMELNLRAVTLTPHVPATSTMALARMLSTDDPSPNADDECRWRSDLVRNGIWKSLKDADIIRDWEREYLVPMLIVAFGLLWFLDSAKSQHSLMLTVLCLTERLQKIVTKTPILEPAT